MTQDQANQISHPLPRHLPQTCPFPLPAFALQCSSRPPPTSHHHRPLSYLGSEVITSTTTSTGSIRGPDVLATSNFSTELIWYLNLYLFCGIYPLWPWTEVTRIHAFISLEYAANSCRTRTWIQFAQEFSTCWVLSDICLLTQALAVYWLHIKAHRLDFLPGFV